MKNQIKSIRQLNNLAGKRVFLRSDFNVPIKNGRIKDDYKILAALPTIRYLLRYRAKIIIATHLGQPSGPDSRYTAKPLARYLAKILGVKVDFIDDCTGVKAKLAANRLETGGILFLENLRFERGEENDSRLFARKLAALADVYVNDAFAVSHRAHASVSAIKKYLPSYAGLLLEKEILSLEKIMNPAEPLVSVIGGAKIGTKIRLIENLAVKSHRLLIGGALANNFLAVHNLNVGKSMVDQESLKFARRLKKKTNILLPLDVVVGKREDGGGDLRAKSANSVESDEYILDIGPKTIRFFSSILKKAATIIWNGPLGKFEVESCRHGTLAIGRVIASRSRGRAFGVVGGGETIEAVKMTGMMHDIDWVSTGGGAMLSYLGKEKMPGMERLLYRSHSMKQKLV